MSDNYPCGMTWSDYVHVGEIEDPLERIFDRLIDAHMDDTEPVTPEELASEASNDFCEYLPCQFIELAKDINESNGFITEKAS